ncbi:MAG: hypothetical protein HY826_05680 [Actinobacteria bacterium]|nr:hypothetical protein [Actinomycetota bacterium]
MTMLTILMRADDIVFVSAGSSYTVPVGVATLTAMIAGDPPLPEELINAIGTIMDHIEDVTRELPGAAAADRIECGGNGVGTIAAVEVGGHAPLPFSLSRAAAEEVFRTIATETASDRALNPGLPKAEVRQVLGVCCAVVAIFRALPAAVIHVVTESDALLGCGEQ